MDGSTEATINVAGTIDLLFDGQTAFSPFNRDTFIICTQANPI